MKTFLVFGPSGVGKTSFGHYLAKSHNFLHLEFDEFSGGGVGQLQLIGEWDAYWCGDEAYPLAAELKNRTIISNADGCIVTLPGNAVPSLSQMVTASKAAIQVIGLFGAPQNCIESFRSREKILDGNWMKACGIKTTMKYIKNLDSLISKILQSKYLTQMVRARIGLQYIIWW